MFKESVIALITEEKDGFPATFCHDFDRLRAFRRDYRRCVFTAACSRTFGHALRRAGWEGNAPANARNQLLQHIHAIAGTDEPNAKKPRHWRSVALEISRAALQLRDSSALPQEAFQKGTEADLRDAFSASSAVREEIRCCIKNEIGKVVHIEAERIYDKSPRQMLDCLYAEPQASGGGVEEMQLSGLSKRVAHLLVLHWKVWAPIFYLQRVESADGGQGSYHWSVEEGGAPEAGTREKLRLHSSSSSSSSSSLPSSS